MKKIIKLEVEDHCLYVTDEDGTIYWFEGALWGQLDEERLKALKDEQTIHLTED